ncbi:MAG: cytochrome C oxidase subunit IV family protein [Thermodesulfovibrionales bacterium]
MTEESIQTKSSFRSYVLTWISLLCLTAVTVTVYYLDLGNAGAAVALLVASVKAGLILVIFMHLRQEGRFLIGIFLIPVLLIGLLIGGTYLDVWYR